MSEPEISANAQHALHAILDGQLTAQETATLAMQYIKNQEEEIQELHQHGAGGLEIAEARSNLLDYVLDILFRAAVKRQEGNTPAVALVAQGGYGRRQLNPASDLDLLFLLPKASHKLPKPLSTLIEEVLYTLWDCGFKVGHACRSIGECISEAKADQQSKTALMDARLISGNEKLFDDFTRKFEKECVQKGQEDFFNLRREDLRRRHSKYSHTVFLQEPHVKESCGGLRDYQNVLWVARVKRGFRSLEELVDAKIITKSTCKQLQAGFDFIHRVRNELHYENGRCTDTLTLRLQGVVANRFAYPQKPSCAAVSFSCGTTTATPGRSTPTAPR